MKVSALEIIRNEISEALKIKNTNKSVGVCPQIPLEARAFDRRLFHYALPCVPKLKNHATPLTKLETNMFPMLLYKFPSLFLTCITCSQVVFRSETWSTSGFTRIYGY